MKPIKSSNLISADYDAENKTCDVEFKNGKWRYFGLQPERWDEWESTFQTEESSGKFFHKYIKPLKCEKL